jgi:hypothetical protein
VVEYFSMAAGTETGENDVWTARVLVPPVVRYFCDWCGQKTGGNEIRIARVEVPPDPPITMEICSDCAKSAAVSAHQGEPLVLPAFKRRRLSRRKPAREPVRGDGEEGGWLPPVLSKAVRAFSTARTRAALPLVRALLYIAVAGMSFYLVTWITAR